MTAYPDLPWPRISDYLLEIGSARDAGEFGRRALSGLNDLVPFDVNGIYAVNDGSGRMCTRATAVEASKWVDLYNNYYWKTQPGLLAAAMVLDWHDLRHTEYVTDFIDPQGIAFSAIITYLEAPADLISGFVLHRSRSSPCFNERDRRILEVIRPHLANFHAINELLAASGVQRLPDAAALAGQYPCLTQREAEIAALICRRFRTSLIASRLGISPLTVYRHVANIFAKLNVFTRDELVEKIVSECPAP